MFFLIFRSAEFKAVIMKSVIKIIYVIFQNFIIIRTLHKMLHFNICVVKISHIYVSSYAVLRD